MYLLLQLCVRISESDVGLLVMLLSPFKLGFTVLLLFAALNCLLDM